MRLELGKSYMEDYMLQRGLPLRKPFRCLNPGHEDRNPSMSYMSKGERIHCFSCGATYDLFDLVGLDYNLKTLREQYEKVCDIFGLDAPPLEYREPSRGNLRLVETEDKDAKLREMRQNASGELDYFLSRGISRESCEKYGLFQYQGRAIFPVWDNDKCAGWCGRAIDGSVVPRYKNSSGAMGIWNAGAISEAGNGKPLYITEGIVDAILLEQMGQKALALCGSQNAQKLIKRCETLRETAKTWRFVACGDPDDAGNKMNTALIEGLGRLGIGCEILPLSPGDGDIGELAAKNPDRLSAILAAEPIPEPKKEPAEYAEKASVAAELDAFFAETERRASAKLISTGINALDRLLDGGMHPGLYVIGAISSLGKTSFILQIADYIASCGTDVLFFSLEQSKRELMAKSMSRASYQIEKGNAFTSRQLLSGSRKNSGFLTKVKAFYAKSAGNLYIREGLADIGPMEVRTVVQEHKKATGKAPVVIVDYLQILKPSEARATDKQNTDRAVVELKRISRDFDIPVIAISSFNRENYRAAVSMEAFKESGAVEYSSDVLFGMQLAGAGTKDFDVNAAKSKEPRRIELVMLKNRSGIPYAKLTFDYYAKFSVFAPLTS